MKVINTNEVPLLVDLQGSPEYQVVADVTNNFLPLPQQSIREFLKFFQSIDLSGSVFLAFQNLMILFEKAVPQTYQDQKKKMTIGIGLNLSEPDAEAIIIAVNKKFGTFYDYSFLAHNEFQPPSPGMSNEQIYYMFYLSLIGVTEQRPDGSTVTFPGEINALIAKLASAGLDNTPFPANQLAALLSMAFNSPNLIGAHLLQALGALSQSPNHLIAMNNVLVEIVERSNKDNTAGVANRRVMEAGTFLGSADKIHMSHRAVQAVLAVDPRPLNGKDQHALPTGDVETTWVGGATVVTEAGTDASGYNTITYGSNAADQLSATAEGSKVMLGGDGDDHLTLTSGVSGTAEAHYLAGNAGWDRYEFGSTNLGSVMITDSDSHGVLVGPDGKPLVGIAVSSGKENEYTLNGQDLKLVTSNSVTGEATHQLQVDFGDNTFPVKVLDYSPGQFGIIYGSQVQNLSLKYNPALLSNGLFGIVIGMPGAVTVQIVDMTGKVMKEVKIAVPNLQQGYEAVVAGSGGGLCITYLQLFRDETHTINQNLYYQTFDADLLPLSGERLIAVYPGDYQIAYASRILRMGNTYVFGFNLVRHMSNKGNYAGAFGEVVGFQVHGVDMSGELLYPPQIAFDLRKTGSTFQSNFIARREGGILIYVEEQGVHDSSRIGIFDAALVQEKTVTLPARVNILRQSFTDIDRGFLACLKPAGSSVYQLAIYQLGDALKFVPVPHPKMDELTSFFGVNGEYVFAIVSTSSITGKGIGLMLNKAGEMVLSQLNIGDMVVSSTHFAPQDRGLIRMFMIKGILSKTVSVVDLNMSEFSLKPGQQRLTLTDASVEGISEALAYSTQASFFEDGPLTTCQTNGVDWWRCEQILEGVKPREGQRCVVQEQGNFIRIYCEQETESGMRRILEVRRVSASPEFSGDFSQELFATAYTSLARGAATTAVGELTVSACEALKVSPCRRQVAKALMQFLAVPLIELCMTADPARFGLQLGVVGLQGLIGLACRTAGLKEAGQMAAMSAVSVGTNMAAGASATESLVHLAAGAVGAFSGSRVAQWGLRKLWGDHQPKTDFVLPTVDKGNQLRPYS